MTPWLLVVAGCVLLVVGADVLVRGASAIAVRFGLSPLVIGLTVVAFGTSAPEFAVSAAAAADGRGTIAFGNVVGSNVFNVLCVLGIAAIVRPLTVVRTVVRTEIPVMIGISLLVWGLAADGAIGRVEGGLLAAGLVAWTVATVVVARRTARGDRIAGSAPTPAEARSWPIPAATAAFTVGLVVLVFAARLVVTGASDIAAALGASELVIGLTVVAAGTSLPEVATSVVAAARGRRDLAVGNVVGSNVFNLLGVLGVAGAVAPDGIPVPPAAVGFDLPVMVAAAAVCLPIAFTGGEIRRWEGGVLLGLYVAFTTHVVLEAVGSGVREPFGTAMTMFVLPLVGLAIATTTIRAARARRNRGD